MTSQSTKDLVNLLAIKWITQHLKKEPSEIMEENIQLRQQLYQLMGTELDQAKEAILLEFPGLTNLTKLESRIFWCLHQAKGRMISKEALLTAMYFDSFKDDRPEAKMLDVLVCRIRQKLYKYSVPFSLYTIWAQGYSLRPGEPLKTQHTKAKGTRTPTNCGQHLLRFTSLSELQESLAKPKPLAKNVVALVRK